MLHGNINFDRKYYARFFREDGELDFSTYENWFSGWYKFIKPRVPLGYGHGKKVLEVGCAIGAFSKILSENGYKVTATDISDFILEKARKQNNKVKFKILDIEKRVLKSQQYDYVFAFEVLEHLKSPKTALKNINSLLKSGGTFVFSTPFLSNQTLKDPTHINVHDPPWWLKSGKSSGFSKVSFTYASFLPFLYRWNKMFSVGLPIKINNAFANSTSIFFFKK